MERQHRDSVPVLLLLLLGSALVWPPGREQESGLVPAWLLLSESVLVLAVALAWVQAVESG